MPEQDSDTREQQSRKSFTIRNAEVSTERLELELDRKDELLEQAPFTHPPFTDPKNEIRLLELQAGAGDEEIRCRLFVCDRAALPDYEAISYTWGDTSGTWPVHIDGKIMSVGENCWNALQQVRRSNQTRLVWIDAISINQQDQNEKNHQVQEMARVYQNADKVLVSLGTVAHDADFLFDWVDELYYQSRHPEYRPRRKHRGKSWADLDSKWSARRGERDNHAVDEARDWVLNWFDKIEPDGFDRFGQALMHLGCHPYWQRIWVQPELAFARDAFLFYGTDTCRLSVMEVVFKALVHFARERPEMSTRYSVTETARTINTLVALPMKATLDKLSSGRLEDTRDGFGGFSFQELSKLKCSEPRDRIFAVIPLVDWQRAGMSTLTVDYELSKFSLAQECITFCTDFWEVKSLLACLELGCKHTEAEISSFLRVRTGSPFTQPPRLRIGAVCECPAPQPNNLMYFYCFYYFDIRGHSLEDTPGAYKVVKDYSKGRTAPQTGEVIAHVPKTTAPSDIVLSVPIGRSASASEGLVIRRDYRGVYEIVGQAILEATYSEQHYSRYPVGYELRLNQEDAMAFIVQGASSSDCCQESMQSAPFHRSETPFSKSRFSSYAVDYQGSTSRSDSWNWDYRESNRTRKFICTVCGEYLPYFRSQVIETEPSLAIQGADTAAEVIGEIHAEYPPRKIVPVNTGWSEPRAALPLNTIHRAESNFAPAMNDELGLTVGQLIRFIALLGDGWVLCTDIKSGQRGVCPLVCLSEHPTNVTLTRSNPPRPPNHLAPLADIGPYSKYGKSREAIAVRSMRTRTSDRETQDRKPSSGWSKYFVNGTPLARSPSALSKENQQRVAVVGKDDEEFGVGLDSPGTGFERANSKSPAVAEGTNRNVRRLSPVEKLVHVRSSSAGVVEPLSNDSVLSTDQLNIPGRHAQEQLGRPKARSLLGPITHEVSGSDPVRMSGTEWTRPNFPSSASSQNNVTLATPRAVTVTDQGAALSVPTASAPSVRNARRNVRIVAGTIRRSQLAELELNDSLERI